jgi:hypothetical protein
LSERTLALPHTPANPTPPGAPGLRDLHLCLTLTFLMSYSQ